MVGAGGQPEAGYSFYQDRLEGLSTRSAGHML